MSLRDTVMPPPDLNDGGMVKFKTFAPVLLLAALLLSGTVACSSLRSGTGQSAAGSDQEQALKFTQCMRDHGVDMPDPAEGNVGTGARPSGEADTGSLDVGGVDAIDLSAGNEAFEACRKFLPNGGEAQKPTAAELEQMVQYAQCMRAHGIDYPDPNADGAVQAFDVPFGDDAAMQRFDEAARACDTASSPAPKR